MLGDHHSSAIMVQRKCVTKKYCKSSAVDQLVTDAANCSTKICGLKVHMKPKIKAEPVEGEHELLKHIVPR